MRRAAYSMPVAWGSDMLRQPQQRSPWLSGSCTVAASRRWGCRLADEAARSFDSGTVNLAKVILERAGDSAAAVCVTYGDFAARLSRQT